MTDMKFSRVCLKSATYFLIIVSAFSVYASKASPESGTSSYFTAAHSLTLDYSTDVPGLNTNPLKGFIPFAKTTTVFPYSMEWFYIPLRDIMTNDNTFNWTALDKQLNEIASRGHQAAFRIYVDYPKRATGIPQFLLDDELSTFTYTDAANTTSISPDYQDKRLIKAFTDVIRALGARYDGDPRIGYITAGLYGFWGEWHVHSHPVSGESSRWKMLQADKDILLNAYIKAFKQTIILVRYATVTNDTLLKKSFGYHDDSFAYQTLGPGRSDFWVQMTAARLIDQWKSYPVGGEVRPEIQETVWDSWPNTTGQDMSTSITTTHASWMINSGVFRRKLADTQYANALRAHRMLGYELYVSSVSLQPRDGSLILHIEMGNRGVAPFYYNWQMQLAFTDARNSMIGNPTNTDWALKSMLPGTTKSFEITLPAPSTQAHKLLMRVKNPLSNGVPLSFANKTQDSTLPGWLTLAGE
jgi:hypothetical protein